MNEWWQSLAPREQTLVGTMGAFFVVVMIYFLLLQPLFSGASDTRERVAEAEKKLEWMKKQAPRLSANSNVSTGPAGDTLISIVDRSTKSLNLQTKGVQKVGTDKVRVQFDQSSFENMVKWFGALQSDPWR